MKELKIRHNILTLKDYDKNAQGVEIDNINMAMDKLLEDLEQIVILGYLERKESGELSKIRELNPNIERVKERVIQDPNEKATISKLKNLIELSLTSNKDKDVDVDLKKHNRADNYQ